MERRPNARSRAARRVSSGGESWFSTEGVCEVRYLVFGVDVGRTKDTLGGIEENDDMSEGLAGSRGMTSE